jgi:hypothetical protein
MVDGKPKDFTPDDLRALKQEGLITLQPQLNGFVKPALGKACAFKPPGVAKMVGGCLVYPHFG